MTGQRIFTIIMGVLLTIGGIWCMTVPLSTVTALVWIFGIFMFVRAVAEIATYRERKAAGFADGFSLAMSIISLIFGLLLIVSWKMQLVAVDVLLLFIFFWLIFGGVMSIVSAVQLKRLFDMNPVAGIIIGIIMILVGMLGIAHPLVAAMSVGLIVGINIAVSGIDLVVRGFTGFNGIHA